MTNATIISRLKDLQVLPYLSNLGREYRDALAAAAEIIERLEEARKSFEEKKKCSSHDIGWPGLCPDCGAKPGEFHAGHCPGQALPTRVRG